MEARLHIGAAAVTALKMLTHLPHMATSLRQIHPDSIPPQYHGLMALLQPYGHWTLYQKVVL